MVQKGLINFPCTANCLERKTFRCRHISTWSRLTRRWPKVRCRRGKSQTKGEANMAGGYLWIKLQVGGKCICFPGEHALIGAIGFFARDVQLPAGTPVAVKFYRGQDEVSLRGTVSANYADLGISVEFNQGSSVAVWKLVTLLADYHGPVSGTKETGGEAMKVRELAARLAKADPEDIVAIDTNSQCLLLLNQKRGMFQPLDELQEEVGLTERDKEFLHVVRVRF